MNTVNPLEGKNEKETASNKDASNMAAEDSESGGRPRPSPRTRIWVFRFLAVIIPLALLEIAARLYFFLFVFDLVPDVYNSDEGIPYRFPPNSSFQVAGTPTTTNNLAVRGNENIDPFRPFDGTRIVCLGDSATFGYCVSGNENSYPAMLEKKLKARGFQVQVVNGGMPRYRMQHVATFYRQHLRSLRPDVVILLGGWNNANDQILIRRRNSFLVFCEEYWFTYRMIKSWNLVPKNATKSHYSADINDDGIQKYDEALANIKQFVQKLDGTPLFCTLPHFFENVNSNEEREKSLMFCPGGTLEQINLAVSKMNAVISNNALQGFPAIDLSAVNNAKWFGDAIHPNDRGSEFIAELIAEYLVQKKLVVSRVK